MAAGNQQKQLKFTISIEVLSFHLRTSIRAQNISSNTCNGYTSLLMVIILLSINHRHTDSQMLYFLCVCVCAFLVSSLLYIFHSL